MKKYIFLFVVLFPMVSLAAPSVRMLGNRAAVESSGVKVTPVRAASTPKAISASRGGAVRAKTNTVAGSSATTARFPVITPAHSYNAVVKPQTTGGSQVIVPAGIDEGKIIDDVKGEIVNNYLNNYYNKDDIDNNYYTKEEINNTINNLEPKDDPRVDMVRVSNNGSPESKWDTWRQENPELYQQRLDEGYVFMWIEQGESGN